MRYYTILFAFVLSGCVSQSRPDFSQAKCVTQEIEDPDGARNRIALGLTYLTNGDLSKAKLNIDKAVELAPYMADSHYSLAYYYQTIGENDSAMEVYDNARRLERLKPDIKNSYAALLCEQNQYQEAKRYFERAIQNGNYARKADIYESLAICAQKQGYKNDAIGYLKSALQQEPERIKTLTLLAQLYMEEEEYEQADTIFDQLEEFSTVDDNLLWLRMDNARQQNNLQMMQNYGNILLSVYPNSPLTRNYLTTKNQLESDNKLKTDELINPATLKIPEKFSPEPYDDTENVAMTSENKNPSSFPQSGDDYNQQDILEELTGIQNNQDSPIFHIVKPKQNLYRISKLYNTTVSQLIKLNGLKDPSNIKIGMKIWLVSREERNNVGVNALE